MPERGDTEVFSNPLPPQALDIQDEDDVHPLTNDDFRKLLMTPRHPSKSTTSSTAASAVPKPAVLKEIDTKDDDDPASKRRKKKIYYAKLKKLEEERQKELEEKYRDRANERREGSNKDYEQTDIISTTADYRAVAPNAQAGENYAERRKQIIQESKYLGGDMEHTHLVKGLDYALLEKVRAEITNKEEQEEEMKMEEAVTEKKKDPEKEDPEALIQFRTRLGRNVFRVLFKNQHPERNELFLPGRMAYVVDLEDEYTESDIPTTLIRSKADCPSLESTTTMTTNDIVINKLTQILSYLRQGRRDKKLKKKEKAGKLKEDDKPIKMADDSIYGDIGDYAPNVIRPKEDKRDRKDRDRDRDRNRHDRERDRDPRERENRERYRERYDRDRPDRAERERDRAERDRPDRDRSDRDRMDRGDRMDRDREERVDRERGDRDRQWDRDQGDRRRSYFEKPGEDEDRNEPEKQSANELVKSINDRFSKGWSAADLEREQHLQPETQEEERKKKIKRKTTINSYAECYPGMMESADAIDDSDDEVDYTKMDQGNKKGPIGRWDFDTQEEYSDYMANKEALPKAAFQYGVKMADGRKTRRTGPKDEKKELDREWQKIQNIISKRKQGGGGGADERSSKQAKY